MIWRDTDVRMIWKTLLLIFFMNVFPPNKWGMYLYYLVITRDKKKKYILGLKQTQKAFFLFSQNEIHCTITSVYFSDNDQILHKRSLQEIPCAINIGPINVIRGHPWPLDLHQ